MRAGAVGAVQADLQAAEVDAHAALQMLDIIVRGVLLFDAAADAGTDRPFDVSSIIGADQLLDLVFGVVRQFVATAAEKLDAVEFIGIVRGGNDDAGIAFVFAGQVGDARASG